MADWSVPGFTEVRALGSGGFGEVMLARHDGSGTLVAVKYLRQNLLSDPEFTEMFRSEAAVLAAVDDPHVIRLYEYVESAHGAAIVMELVEGVSLREILAREGATTAEAALTVLQGSLLGLAAAHQRGVVHRDYKPENVLVNGQGESKLTDFGIAARAGTSTIPAGSLLYAPPEQFGDAPASPAGDVYAATATFYECLTGRPPFTGDTAEQLLYQHMAEPVPLDPVPEPLRPLVTAGMAKDPRDRPADANRFVTELTAVAAGAYGPEWERRGRSHLGEVAVLLAALWPAGSAPAVQGSAVERLQLSEATQAAQAAVATSEARHLWHLGHLRHLAHERHLRHVRAVAAAAIVLALAGAGTAVALASKHTSAPPPGHPAAAVHLVTLQPTTAAASATRSHKLKKAPASPTPPSSPTAAAAVTPPSASAATSATTSAAPSKSASPSRSPSQKPSSSPSPSPAPAPSPSPSASVTTQSPPPSSPPPGR